MNPSSNFTPAERRESLGAGILAAVSLTAIALFLLGVNSLLLDRPLVPDLDLAVRGAIAGASGFLFGATYRYIIRRDDNSHLKQGAVLAFGLVRGLAIAEAGLTRGEPLPQLVLGGTESLLMFAGTAIVLDFALRRRWIAPFPSEK
ncbi:hypothetical protein [Lyngbya sp. CCY1209]|uniref:hypothetical protein n=1 Tax=Lyngbya sp. CCY1209 TaxID=2886103 RepID=UPI002D210D9C|nr:hypothetical protein [Lyngbya sp. CCY1209]MEB3886289.1 hypothetical protein [Lyngbya sp. CCY1209]